MQKFINPGNVIAHTGLAPGQHVADFGCGAGFYTIPSAQLVGDSGLVYAVDVMESKLAVTQSSARQAGLKNIVVVQADLDKPITNIPEGSCDLVVMASIVHQIDSKDALIQNAYRMLKTGGKVLAVDWKKERTPFGPALEKRVAPEELVELMSHKGFRKDKDIPADSYHYAALFTK